MNADALAAVLTGSVTAPFAPDDLAELVVLQRCCWVQEAITNDLLSIPALHETHEQVLAWATEWMTVVVRLRGRLVAAVRGLLDDDGVWQVGRLMVAPDLAGRGVGSALLALIESLAPGTARGYALFTGARSERNIRTYERAGYVLAALPEGGAPAHVTGAVYLTKPR